MPLNKRFLLGLALIIGNFIVGKLALPVLALSVELGLAIYLFSWLMLIAGLVLCGHEGLIWARVSFHHFEKKIKRRMLERWRNSRRRVRLIRDKSESRKEAVVVPGSERSGRAMDGGRAVVLNGDLRGKNILRSQIIFANLLVHGRGNANQ